MIMEKPQLIGLALLGGIAIWLAMSGALNNSVTSDPCATGAQKWNAYETWKLTSKWASDDCSISLPICSFGAMCAAGNSNELQGYMFCHDQNYECAFIRVNNDCTVTVNQEACYV